MKIVSIFANKLFAFQYEGENNNEYDRLMELWTDSDFVHQFLKENKVDIPKNLTINKLENYIIADSEELDNQLIEISENEEQELEHFFSPLHNQEYQVRTLSLRKKRERYLRMYAIRIDSDLFVITGGPLN